MSLNLTALVANPVTRSASTQVKTQPQTQEAI